MVQFSLNASSFEFIYFHVDNLYRIQIIFILCIYLYFFFRKLKLYEEQELTMQVFCEPEANRLPVTTTLDRRGSDETSVVRSHFFLLL